MMIEVQKYHQSAGHNGAIYALVAGKSPETILSAGGDGWVVIWDTTSPETGRLLAATASKIFSLHHLVSSKLVIAGNMLGGVHWIDLEDKTNTRNVLHHKKGVFDIVSFNDTQILTGGGDGLLTIWDIESRKTVESTQLSTKSLRSIAPSPSLPLVAVGTSDGHIILIDAIRLNTVETLKIAHENAAFTLAWSPCGQYLLSGGRDAQLKVWEYGSSATMCHLTQPAHWYTINHIAYSPDGRIFATASRDKTIKLWDASTFQLLKVINVQRYGGHTHSVNRLIWQNEFLISASDDRTLIFWRILVNP